MALSGWCRYAWRRSLPRGTTNLLPPSVVLVAEQRQRVDPALELALCVAELLTPARRLRRVDESRLGCSEVSPQVMEHCAHGRAVGQLGAVRDHVTLLVVTEERARRASSRCVRGLHRASTPRSC